MASTTIWRLPYSWRGIWCHCTAHFSWIGAWSGKLFQDNCICKTEMVWLWTWGSHASIQGWKTHSSGKTCSTISRTLHITGTHYVQVQWCNMNEKYPGMFLPVTFSFKQHLKLKCYINLANLLNHLIKSSYWHFHHIYLIREVHNIIYLNYLDSTCLWPDLWDKHL